MRRKQALCILCAVLLFSMSTPGIFGEHGDIHDLADRLEEHIFDFEEMEEIFSVVFDSTEFSFNLLTVTTFDQVEVLFPTIHQASELFEEFSACLFQVRVLGMLYRGEFDQAAMEIIKKSMEQGVKLFAHGAFYAAGIGIIDFALNYTANAVMTAIDQKYWDRYRKYNFRWTWPQVFNAMDTRGYEGVAELLDQFWYLEEVEYAGDLYTFRHRNPDAVEKYRQRFIRDFLLTTMVRYSELQKERRMRDFEHAVLDMAMSWQYTDIRLSGSVVEYGLPGSRIEGILQLKDGNRIIEEAQVQRGSFSLSLPVYLINDQDLWDRELTLKFTSSEENMLTGRTSPGLNLPSSHAVTLNLSDMLGDSHGVIWSRNSVHLPPLTIPTVHAGTIYSDVSNIGVISPYQQWGHAAGFAQSDDSMLTNIPYGRYWVYSYETGVVKELEISSPELFISLQEEPQLPDFVEITKPPIEFHHDKIFITEEVEPEVLRSRQIFLSEAREAATHHYRSIAAEALSTLVPVTTLIADVMQQRRETRSRTEREWYDSELERLREEYSRYENHLHDVYRQKAEFLNHPQFLAAAERERELGNLWRVESARRQELRRISEHVRTMRAHALNREIQQLVRGSGIAFRYMAPQEAAAQAEQKSAAVRKAVQDAEAAYHAAKEHYRTYLEYTEEIVNMGVQPALEADQQFTLRFLEDYGKYDVLPALEEHSLTFAQEITSLAVLPEHIAEILEELEMLMKHPPRTLAPEETYDDTYALESRTAVIQTFGEQAASAMEELPFLSDDIIPRFADYLPPIAGIGSGYLVQLLDLTAQLEDNSQFWGPRRREIQAVIREADSLYWTVRAPTWSLIHALKDAAVLASYPGETGQQRLEHLKKLTDTVSASSALALDEDLEAAVRINAVMEAAAAWEALPPGFVDHDEREMISEVFASLFFDPAMAEYARSEGLYYPEIREGRILRAVDSEVIVPQEGMLVIPVEELEDALEVQILLEPSPVEIPPAVVLTEIKASGTEIMRVIPAPEGAAELMLSSLDLQDILSSHPSRVITGFRLAMPLDGVFYDLAGDIEIIGIGYP